MLTRSLTSMLIAGALLGATAADAQQVSAPPARTITFADAVRIALEQNGALRQAKSATALDAVAVRQQTMQFLPDLRLTAQSAQNYGRTFDQGEGQVVNQTTQSLSTGVSSSVVLFNGLGNLASLRQAQLARDASEADVERARQTAVFTVASDYVALAAQEELLRVRQEDLAAREAEEKQIKAFVDAGTRPISDLYQQQATVASARSAVVDAQRAVELAKVDLMQTLQLDAGGSYDFEAPPVAVDSAAAPAYELNALLARAIARRSDLSALAARQSAAEHGVRAAKAAYWPTISLTLGYNTGYTSASAFTFADQLDQRRGGSIGIGLSIPLFDRSSAQLASQRAEIQADNARLALATQRNQVGLEVRRAYLDYQAAQAQLASAEAQLKAAELALHASQERYRVGAATLLEVTQARAAQVQAASALVSARYTLVLQRSVIAYYTGELVPEQATLG